MKETLSHVVHYMKHGSSIDKENVERHIAGKPFVPTYRIRNNRIGLKEIRGKFRFFVQMVLEGLPVVKRKKDGTSLHPSGIGKIGGDIGTQTLAVVSPNHVDLYNLAERSKNTFYYEREIHLIQRYLNRSKRSVNPQHYNYNGAIKKGKKDGSIQTLPKGKGNTKEPTSKSRSRR